MVLTHALTQAKERAMEEAYLATQPKVRTAADAEEDLRREAAPLTAADAIKRTLLAWKDKDYFRRGPLRP